MRASAHIAAEVRPGGRTRLTALAGQAPLLLRQTDTQQDPPAGPGAARETGAALVHLVGGAAGPLGGDELNYTVDLGPGAHVLVLSVAASIALPGPLGSESTLDITVRVADGARLSWSPQPMIVARGAHHRTTSYVDLVGDARLVWREEVLLGRHGEPPGSVATRLRVRRDGRALLDHTLAAGPRYPGSLGAAVTAADTAIGTIVIVDPDWAHVPPADRLPLPTRDDAGGAVTVLPLPGPAVVVSALAPDGLTLRRLLEPVSRVSNM
ncbi:MAG TPA: urease accessory protein UreD [Actinocrinis sp.]|uniref:urease accessory protein UreD n=1 Tax=Actinocrinis sp. TaxID=1920516 RepID=UPI002DDD4F16|nr:urease accessory protein UreD [Actinocrinis sp.]HEV3169556.1 urease accessory protein UreD [Actinocrinis sp.]